MRISIGNDHAGTAYKLAIVDHLKAKGFEVINHGTDATSSVDYPDFVHPVAQDVVNNKVDFGIVICGSGNGVAITANKYQEVRCSLCWIKEIAQLAREHNNANVLSIPARYTSLEQAIAIVDTFLSTAFEGGRHQNRIDKIACQ